MGQLSHLPYRPRFFSAVNEWVGLDALSIYHTAEFLKFWSSGYFQAPRPIPRSIPQIWLKQTVGVGERKHLPQGAYIKSLSNSNHSKGCKIQSVLSGFNRQGPLKVSSVLKGEWNGVFHEMTWIDPPLWPPLPLSLHAGQLGPGVFSELWVLCAFTCFSLLHLTLELRFIPLHHIQAHLLLQDPVKMPAPLQARFFLCPPVFPLRQWRSKAVFLRPPRRWPPTLHLSSFISCALT